MALQSRNLELSRVITDWHEYSGISIEEIMSNIASCRQRIGDDWRAMVTTAKDDEISKFYGQSENYIYDILTSFTQQEMPIKLRSYRRILAFIRHLAKRRRVNVLEFGGGTGELSLLMQETGAAVTYCDLHGRISDFAVWRFKKHGADIKIVYSQIDRIELTESSYDMVVSDAVLEHLKVEYLRSFVGSLSRSLRATGYLYLLWDPDYNEANPTHILGLSDLDSVLSDSGLVRISENVYARTSGGRNVLLAKLISPLFSLPDPLRRYLLRLLSELEWMCVG